MSKTKLKDKPIIRKFVYAFFGFKTALKEEKSLVIHIIIAAITIIISGVLKISLTQWATIITLIGFVISSELINTMVENIADMVSFKFNLGVKKIKDIAAAATLVIAFTAAIVGLMIFISQIVIMIQRGYY